MDWTRRSLLFNSFALGAYGQIAAAAQHAHAAMQANSAVAFQNFDPATAAEIEALAAQIIPSTDGPGAREAGVIYFIDYALSKLVPEQRNAYTAGMAAVQKRRAELFPQSQSIASLAPEQQMELIKAIEHTDFFDTLRADTVIGFLSDPSYGGNRDKVGWKYIGFDDRMAFDPPFGYYDAQQSGDAK
jgi:gluconate 2-dehydrogenase gamma chain